ncbi:MAG: hypothetical protein V8S98_12615 [Lachnospiraceae bacterium]
MLCDYPNVMDIAAEKLLDLSDEKWVADGGDALGAKLMENCMVSHSVLKHLAFFITKLPLRILLAKSLIQMIIRP